MSSASILVDGLCLWLTATGGARAVVPDFAAAIPAHVAVVSVAKDQIVGGTCPAGFQEQNGICAFPLNGMGSAGGVHVALTPTGGALQMDLCEIPKIQHTLPLTLKPEYSPPSGNRIAAQMLVTQGQLTGVGGGGCANCPRSTLYTLTLPDETLSLSLSNLRFREPLVVALHDGAQVTVSNERAVPLTAGSDDTADWCLYFTMFEEVGCPGKPAPPDCPSLATAQPATTQLDSKMRIETIACSNSQYP